MVAAGAVAAVNRPLAQALQVARARRSGLLVPVKAPSQSAAAVVVEAAGAAAPLEPIPSRNSQAVLRRSQFFCDQRAPLHLQGAAVAREKLVNGSAPSLAEVAVAVAAEGAAVVSAADRLQRLVITSSP